MNERDKQRWILDTEGCPPPDDSLDEAAWRRASLPDPNEYEPTDPKHPDYHDTMADLWDNRDKFA